MIILYDNNGTPVINDSGDLVKIEGTDMAKQIIYNVLTTMKGEDLIGPEYGLDIINLKGIPNISSAVARAFIVEAFNPSVVSGFSILNSVTTIVDGSTIYLTIGVTLEDGTTVDDRVSVEV